MRPKRLYGLYVTLLFLALTSCQEKTFLGTEVIPAVDGINVFYADSFRLITQNFMDDSIPTSSYYMLGIGSCPNFPYTGEVSMDGYIQFGLPNENFTSLIKTGTGIDSVVLVMPYASNYIDSTATSSYQKIGVYSLLDTLSVGKVYYDYESGVADDGVLLNHDPSREYDFATSRDSVVVLGDTLIPQIRIRLNSAFEQKMAAMDSADWSSTYNFHKIFPGFALKSMPGSSSALAFINATGSYLQVYYHRDTLDSLSIKLPYNGIYCNHFTRITKILDPQVESTIDNPDPEGENWDYVSFYPGVLTQVTIPYSSFLDDYIINDAVLEITAEHSDSYPLLDSIFAFKYENDSVKVSLIDYAYNNQFPNYFLGGKKDITFDNGSKARRFELRVTQELIRATKNKKDLVFNLSPFVYKAYYTYYSPMSIRAMKLGGNNRTDDYKMKIKVVYSRR